MIGLARQKLDAAGSLTDGTTARHVRALLEAFVAWTQRLEGRAGRPPSLGGHGFRSGLGHQIARELA